MMDAESMADDFPLSQMSQRLEDQIASPFPQHAGAGARRMERNGKMEALTLDCLRKY